MGRHIRAPINLATNRCTTSVLIYKTLTQGPAYRPKSISKMQAYPRVKYEFTSGVKRDPKFNLLQTMCFPSTYLPMLIPSTASEDLYYPHFSYRGQAVLHLLYTLGSL